MISFDRLERDAIEGDLDAAREFTRLAKRRGIDLISLMENNRDRLRGEGGATMLWHIRWCMLKDDMTVSERRTAHVRLGNLWRGLPGPHRVDNRWCGRCGGTGVVWDSKCATCLGTGEQVVPNNSLHPLCCYVHSLRDVFGTAPRKYSRWELSAWLLWLVDHVLIGNEVDTWQFILPKRRVPALRYWSGSYQAIIRNDEWVECGTQCPPLPEIVI